MPFSEGISQDNSVLIRPVQINTQSCSQNLTSKHLDTSVVKNTFCLALAASNSWLIQNYCIYWFAKTLASIYCYSDLSNYTTSVKENILFLFSSVKVKGEMILKDKKSWTLFLVESRNLCLVKWKKKKNCLFPLSFIHTHPVIHSFAFWQLFSFCFKSHRIFYPSPAMKSVYFAAPADGAVLVKDSISFKKEALWLNRSILIKKKLHSHMLIQCQTQLWKLLQACCWSINIAAKHMCSVFMQTHEKKPDNL